MQNLMCKISSNPCVCQGTGQRSLLHLEQHLSQKRVKHENAVPIKILIQTQLYPGNFFFFWMRATKNVVELNIRYLHNNFFFFFFTFLSDAGKEHIAALAISGEHCLFLISFLHSN